MVTPKLMSILLFGAMIPYMISAASIKAIGFSLKAIVAEFKSFQKVQRDIKNNFFINSNVIANSSCTAVNMVAIITSILVVLVILVGVFFGPQTVIGFVIGIIISSIQIGFSSTNSGIAWTNSSKSLSSYYLI